MQQCVRADHEIVDADSNRIIESKIREDVAKAIIERTGMDFKRFTRSMLLAQGGFAAFLQSRPDDRAPILEQITGTSLAKGETRSDWLRRPLSPAQLEYAADDVRHLDALHDATSGRLRELGREAWLAEDVERMLASADRDEGETWPHLALRSAQFLDAAGQRRLLRLLRWRERHAREHDLPRSWVLDNELAVALSRDPPIDEAGLQRQLDATPKSPRRLAAAIWQALSTALPDEDGMPMAAGDPDRNAIRRLQDAVARRSGELGLPDGVLGSRRHLEALLESGQWPPALQGWRRDELEPVLAPLLAPAPATG